MLKRFRFYQQLGSYGFSGAQEICAYFRAVRLVREIKIAERMGDLDPVAFREFMRRSDLHPLAMDALLGPKAS